MCWDLMRKVQPQRMLGAASASQLINIGFAGEDDAGTGFAANDMAAIASGATNADVTQGGDNLAKALSEPMP